MRQVMFQLTIGGRGWASANELVKDRAALFDERAMTTGRATSIDRTEPPAHGSRTIHLFHHKFGRGGGMEQYALALTNELLNRGFHVVFHCRRKEERAMDHEALEIRCHAVSRFPRRLQDYRFFRQVEAMAPGIRELQLSLTRLPVRDAVVCGGTHRGFLRGTGKWNGPFHWLQAWMESRAYASARRIVSHSRLCANEMVELYGVAPEKITTLHPAVSPEFKPPDQEVSKQEYKKRLGLPGDRAVFLFPSTGHKRKGLKPILRAFAEVSDRAVLAIAGKPTGGLPSYARSLGYIDRMAEAYAAADFTLLGSYYEPFGLVGIESLICGTPLVFEQSIGCLEVVKPAAVETFNVREEASITGAIRTALEKSQSLREGARNGLSYDASMQAHVSKLIETIDSQATLGVRKHQ